MLELFIFVLILTFVLVRISTSIWDHPGSDKSDVHTPTKLLSRALGIEIHHQHLGLIFIIIAGILIFLSKSNYFNTILLSAGCSLVLDQLPFLLFYRKTHNILYFKPLGIFLSFLSHLAFIGTIFFLS